MDYFVKLRVNDGREQVYDLGEHSWTSLDNDLIDRYETEIEDVKILEVKGFDGDDKIDYTQYSIEELYKWIDLYDKYENLLVAAILHFGSFSYAKEEIEEYYAGVYPSYAAFGEWIVDHVSYITLDQRLHPYVDFDQFARDLETSGEVEFIEVNGQVHVFYK